MKRITSLLLALALCLGMLTMTASAADVNTDAAALRQNTAEALKSLNLFRGSNLGFELDRAPTRMEAIIMLIRLLGMENEALGGMYTEHPFTDAPVWQNANEYLAYAYTTGLTNGRTTTTFDPQSPASLREVVTLTLRALGYVDTEAGKIWDLWADKAKEAGLDTNVMATETFTRGDAVLLYWNALSCKVNGSEQVLSAKLMENWVFDENAYAAAQLIAKDEIDLATSDLNTIMSALYAKIPATFYSIMHTEIDKADADSQTWYMGTSELSFKEALAAEPMMMAQAHSVVLVRLNRAADAEKAMETMKANVDGRKWICVGVEPDNIRTAAEGKLVLLVLDNQYSQQFVDAFQSMAK